MDCSGCVTARATAQAYRELESRGFPLDEFNITAPDHLPPVRKAETMHRGNSLCNECARQAVENADQLQARLQAELDAREQTGG